MSLSGGGGGDVVNGEDLVEESETRLPKAAEFIWRDNTDQLDERFA